MGVRERKRELTRDALFDAAVALFVEQGYEATTMEAIAERAVVSRATAFNYFPKKEDLLLEWAARRRAAVAAAARADAARGRPPAIRSLLVRLAGTYTQDPAAQAFTRAWLTSAGPLKPGAWESAVLLADLVRAGQDAGALAAEADPEVVGRLLLNAFLGALYQWVSEDRPKAWLRREVGAAVDVILAGVGTFA